MKEQLQEKYQQVKDHVKDHVKEHREGYIAGGAAFVVGGLAVGTAVVLRQGTIQTAAVVQGIAYKSPVSQHVVQFVERSTPSKPIHLVGTDRYFPSMSDAARQTGHSLGMIAHVVHGRCRSVGGDVFEFVEKIPSE